MTDDEDREIDSAIAAITSQVDQLRARADEVPDGPPKQIIGELLRVLDMTLEAWRFDRDNRNPNEGA